jgi:hypothetical protein
MRPSIVKIAAWGEQYIEKFQNYLEPILSTQNNLPALTKLSPTIVMLFTDKADLQPFKNIGGGLQVQIVTVQADDNVHHGRILLAKTDEMSIQFATDRDADWFDFQADTIVDDSFLLTLKNLLEDHDIVLGSSFRTDFNKYNEIVPKGLHPNAESLYNVSLAAMHPNTLKYFVRSAYSIIPADPHQFFFSNGNGFNGRTWQPRPYAFRASKITKRPEQGIDVHIVSRFDFKRAYFQTELPGSFYQTSLDIEQPSFGNFPMTPECILRSMCQMAKNSEDLANYRKALQIQYKFNNPANIPLTLPTDCLDENATISDLLLVSMGHNPLRYRPTWP